MSDHGLARRKQQLLDKFLAGEIDETTYDKLLAQLHELGTAIVASSVSVEPGSGEPGAGELGSGAGSSSSFVVTESRTSAERSALSSPVALLEAGMELGGFQLKRRLRRGGMGEVWQAHDPTGERSVVIKVLPPELQRSPDEMARVKQTFNRVHNLQHQHICPVYLLGQDPRFGYFIVMKYLDGDTLSAYRKTRTQQRGAFPLSDVIRVLTPIAQALDYAHGRQIIHRDIKPQNIMLNADGSDVQLVDFGLAAEVRTSVMRISQVQMETCGTYPYMAPEQWRGEMQDARTDQYALAVMAFELLAGHLPYEAADPTVLRMCVLNDPLPVHPQISEGVHAVIVRGMAKARADRFENCIAFTKALLAAGPLEDRIEDDVPIPAKVTTPKPSSVSRPVVVSSKPVSPVLNPQQPMRPGTARPGSPTVARPTSVTSKPSGRKNDDDELVFLDDPELVPEDHSLMEPDDDRAAGRARERKSRAPTVRQVRGEATMEKVNARAMLWVGLIGGSVCVLFMGLFSWFVWNGMHRFFGPGASGPESNSSQLATNDETSSSSVVVPPAVRPDDKNSQALRYRWEQGKKYTYSVKVEMEPDPDVVVSMSGNTTYSLGLPVARKPGAPEAGKGTGTGFVVQANGYLVTCQHVVDGAAEIEVAIGGKKYPATVVVEDVEHDLAIIRIEASDLPTLSLADSDKVQLGEEVRAVGFPFSSILGDNVKATRGTISGVNQEEDRKVFQVDAGINPGNSGGPLVNERGDVIGVNFAKLREEVATNVGFAVPINDAITLLRSERVTFVSGDGKSPKLEGPELVKLVSAATALITVNSGGGAAAGLHHYELRCEGALNSSVRSKSGKSVNISSAIPRHHIRTIAFSQPDVVETDPLGRVHEITGERNSLPGFMGPLSIMVLEQLPSIRRRTWSHSFAMTIVISEENGDPVGHPMRFGRRFGPPGFPGFPGGAENVPKTTQIPCRIRIAYSLQEAVGDLIKVKKEFELEARERPAGEPRIKLNGSGVWTFDTKSGIPLGLDYSAMLIENEHNKTTRLPIKLSYQLADRPGGAANVALAPDKTSDAAQPGPAVENATPLAVGTRLVAEWAGKWLPVEVLEVKPDGKVRIHWIGWGNQFDEELARTRLRFPLGVNPAPPTAVEPAVVTDVPHNFTLKLTLEEIDQSLADLQNKNAGTANSAANKLQHAVPLDERREQVLTAFEGMLKNKDQFRRKQAVEGLGNWANRDTIPILIRCLDESALLVKLAAIDALGKLKDERAAEPLAKLAAEPGPRVQAAKSLQMLGAKAETAVLSLLTHAEPEVRQEACRLLKVLGTAACLPALQKAANDPDRTVAASAKDAAAAVSKRQ